MTDLLLFYLPAAKNFKLSGAFNWQTMLVSHYLYCMSDLH